MNEPQEILKQPVEASHWVHEVINDSTGSMQARMLSLFKVQRHMAAETELDRVESRAWVQQIGRENFAAYQRGLEDYILQRIIWCMNLNRRFFKWAKGSDSMLAFAVRWIYITASIIMATWWLWGKI